MRPSRSRRHSVRRRRGPSEAALACGLAGLALVAVMGVTSMNRTSRKSARPTAAAPTPTSAPKPPTPRIRAVPPASRGLLDRLAGRLEQAQTRMRKLRKTERGPAFEPLRVEALAILSEAREELGAYLDAHGNDDRANRLWDRLQLLYVALKKI